MGREAIAEDQAAPSYEIARVTGEPQRRAGPGVSVAPATALALSGVSVAPATALALSGVPVAPATALGSPAFTLRVSKLHCEGCSETLHRALSAVAGVREVAVSIELPEEAEGLARIWGGSSGAPLDVGALINAAVAAGKPAEVYTPPASIEGPLGLSERAELLYLRKRVQDLEAAIGRLSSLVVQPPTNR
jgi:copper chaperone CopZ